jgi:hypothetical protein
VPLTNGAAFIGGTSVVAILHDNGIIEAVDVQNTNNTHDFGIGVTAISVGDMDVALATSPDGRWIGVGQRRGIGFAVIDVHVIP